MTAAVIDFPAAPCLLTSMRVAKLARLQRQWEALQQVAISTGQPEAMRNAVEAWDALQRERLSQWDMA